MELSPKTIEHFRNRKMITKEVKSQKRQHKFRSICQEVI